MMSRALLLLGLALVAGLSGCHTCGDCGDKSCGSFCLHCHKVYEQSPQYRPPGPWFADLDCCERTRAKHGIAPDDDGAYSDGYANDSPEKQLAKWEARQRRGLFRRRNACDEECLDYPMKKPVDYCPR